MTTVSIDGYLDQGKLEGAFRQVVGEAAWRGSEVRVEPRRFKWDMVFEWGGARIAVEYDGDEHYRHSLKVKADREKDALARSSGIKVVRFPYWVQLTTETLRHYFDLEAQVVQDFAHGFITTKIFPASSASLVSNVSRENLACCQRQFGLRSWSRSARALMSTAWSTWCRPRSRLSSPASQDH
jgi:very-short-patch-repair endonuclease